MILLLKMNGILIILQYYQVCIIWQSILIFCVTAKFKVLSQKIVIFDRSCTLIIIFQGPWKTIETTCQLKRLSGTGCIIENRSLLMQPSWSHCLNQYLPWNQTKGKGGRSENEKNFLTPLEN